MARPAAVPTRRHELMYLSEEDLARIIRQVVRSAVSAAVPKARTTTVLSGVVEQVDGEDLDTVFIRMDSEAMSADPTESQNYEEPGVIPMTRLGQTFDNDQVRAMFHGPSGADAMLTSEQKLIRLPYGAEDGQRIEIDGEEGEIRVYDSAGDLVLYMFTEPSPRLAIDIGGKVIQLADDGTGNPILHFQWPAVAATGGRIDLSTLGGSYDSALRIAAPQDTAGGADQAQVVLASEDVSAGLPPTWRLRDTNGGSSVDVIRVDGGSSADIRFDHPSTALPALSLPRGLVATTGQVTSDEGPYSVDTTSTSMVLSNVPHAAGREYLFVLNGLAELSAASGSWQANLLLNGAYIGTFSRVTNEAAALARHPINGVVSWIAPDTTATDDFAVQLDERTGTADITLIGGLTATSPPRILSVYDMGVPPA